MKEVSAQLVVLAVRVGRLETLFVRLPGNRWDLPGGPVAPGVGVARAAQTHLAHQTGVRGVTIEQLYTFDRGDDRALSVAHLALVSADRHPLAPGTDVVEVRWFGTRDTPVLGEETAEVLAYGHARVRAKAAYAPIAMHLLPEVFTLGELQEAYEAVLGHPLDTRNFRRDVLAGGLVADAGGERREGPGRPARLYRSTGADFQVLARERRIARAIAASG
ncbi:MAG: NUDIX domain-containing protein [Miltoncostaeaceae bacterium]